VTEILDRRERAMLLAVRDDALRQRWTDAGQAFQILGRRAVDIDGLNGRPLLST
jgi:hypothetical protein